MTSARDREFAEFAKCESAPLLRCAYLCHGQETLARDVVESALASAYAHWKRPESARLETLRLVSQPEASNLYLPWRSKRRVHLLDVTPTRSSSTSMLVRELNELPDEARRVLVLSLIGELTTSQLSSVVGTGEDDVQRRLDVAQDRMHSRRAVYGSRGTLTEALHRAVPSGLSESQRHPETDRAHGLYLLKARRRRVLALATAAVAAVILVVQGVGSFRPETDISSQRPAPVASIIPKSAPTFAPLPPETEAPCNTNNIACRDVITKLWMYEIFDVAMEYVDPEGDYFTIVGYDEDKDVSWLGDGAGGALGVNVISLDGGTQLYVQIATSRELAVQCGARTDRSCVRQRFLSGNWYTLTESPNAIEGIEVQFAPYDEVITIVARDSGEGKTLPIDRGQLMQMIEDPRLRLPAI